MLDKFGMVDSVATQRLFQQGLPIDRVDRTITPECETTEFIRNYQSIMGGLTWLVINTRPDINVATKLLSKFNCKPSKGHLESAKYLLRYLKGTASHGIWFTQGKQRLHGNVGFPDELDPNNVAVFIDSCWGPQDASQPRPNDTRTAYTDEMNSLQGHYITRMGGPLTWGVNREKRTSGSSCKAEIKAMDEGTKSIQFLRHLMTQLGLIDTNYPIPVLNDNRGSVDWAKNGGIVTKKLRRANIRETRVAEAHEYGEVEVYWIPGKDNPADLFTKEHKDHNQFNKLRDLMVRPREWIHADCKDVVMDEAYNTKTVISNKKTETKLVRFASLSEGNKKEPFGIPIPDMLHQEVNSENTMDSLQILMDPEVMWKQSKNHLSRIPGGCCWKLNEQRTNAGLKPKLDLLLRVTKKSPDAGGRLEYDLDAPLCDQDS